VDVGHCIVGSLLVTPLTRPDDTAILRIAMAHLYGTIIIID
jgi:hypothetical protein